MAYFTAPVILEPTKNEELGADWTKFAGRNGLKATTTGFAANPSAGVEWYNLVSYGPNCECWIELGTFTAGTEIAFAICMQGAPDYLHYALAMIPEGFEVIEYNQAENTERLIHEATVSTHFASGQKVALWREGHKLKAIREISGVETVLWEGEDSGITAGGYCILSIENGSSRVKKFAAQTLSSGEVKVELSSTLSNKLTISAQLTANKSLKSTVESKLSLTASIKLVKVLPATVIGSKFSLVSPLATKGNISLSSKIESKLTLFAPIHTRVSLSSNISSKVTVSAALSVKTKQQLSSDIYLQFGLYAPLQEGLIAKLGYNLNSNLTIYALLSSKHPQETPNIPQRLSERRIYPGPSVVWNWWLCKTSNLGQIAELNSAHSKQLQLMLNSAGKASFWMHLEDDKSYEMEELKTSIVCYRNGKEIFGGRIYEGIDNATNTQESTFQVTALGWFEDLNHRIIHTGLEWKEMAVKASGRTIVRYEGNSELENSKIEEQYSAVLAEGFYVPVATESAQELYYANIPMSLIINDLIIRANIDVPTGITIGETAPTNSINITLHQFENVGETIKKITELESGPDLYITPTTRKFNTIRNEFYSGNETLAGLGRNRGSGIRFTFPGNCLMANRSRNGTKTQNRTENTGMYGVGKSENTTSIAEYGLFEDAVSSPEVTNTNILIARATVETEFLKEPYQIVTFNPKSVAQSDIPTPAVPRPFEDYEIGDIVYSTVKKGRLEIGMKSPQAVRVFGMTVSPEDSGSEVVTNIQTTYSEG